MRKEDVFGRRAAAGYVMTEVMTWVMVEKRQLYDDLYRAVMATS